MPAGPPGVVAAPGAGVEKGGGVPIEGMEMRSTAGAGVAARGDDDALLLGDLPHRRAELLGRRVRRRADLGGRVLAIGLEDLGDAEVHHLEQWLAPVIGREEEVRRLEIAVDDARAVGL